MENLWQDLRYGVRTLRQRPGFTLVAVVTLAIGIGANTAIFSLVNAILLRPLPVKDPARLVNVHSTSPDGSSFHAFSYPDYVDFRERSGVFEDLLAYNVETYSLNTGEQSERVFGMVTTGNTFDVLGVRPALGRFFTLDEDRPANPALVAVLGHGYWQRRFGGDVSLVGRTLALNGQKFTVVGIARRSSRACASGSRGHLRADVVADAHARGSVAVVERPRRRESGNRRAAQRRRFGRDGARVARRVGATVRGAVSGLAPRRGRRGAAHGHGPRTVRDAGRRLYERAHGGGRLRALDRVRQRRGDVSGALGDAAQGTGDSPRARRAQGPAHPAVVDGERAALSPGRRGGAPAGRVADRPLLSFKPPTPSLELDLGGTRGCWPSPFSPRS